GRAQRSVGARGGEQLHVGVGGAAAVAAEHLAGRVVAVEHLVELAGDKGLQLAAVGGELGAARLQRRQQALGVVEHQLARRSGLGGGGRGGLGLRGGRERRHGEQGGGEREGHQGTGHSVGSVGDGV